MLIQMQINQLPTPEIEFGAPGTFIDPKVGLTEAGPFDLRFGAAHKREVRVGFVGNTEILNKGYKWIERCCKVIPTEITDSPQYQDFPGFSRYFSRYT